jgi:predicted anti-sigma-YlaC factor YlaD
MQRSRGTLARTGIAAAILLASFLVSGCSVRALAINALGDALAEGGQTYARDDDPALVAAAIPFGLKTIEALIEQAPKHIGLLLAAASGFTQYAYAFVQEDADEMEEADLAAAIAKRARARRLYARARDYGLRGLEAGRPGLAERLRSHPKIAVSELGPADVPLMYWSAAAWGAAIALSKDDPAALADLPASEALIDRALFLDEDFGAGDLHVFLISYEPARQPPLADRFDRARRHFERAVELSRGNLAGPYVAMAESVSIAQGNRAEFESLLEKAVAIDPDAVPDFRLANLVSQRRARWLLSRADDLFL